jgi:S-adenosyl-L-methionine hydrolase (adenosine-forming)
MKRPLITLTTDFGLTDGYVGAMKGVLYTLCPEANVIDISHAVAPQDIQKGSIVLRDVVGYYPRGAVHVAVVDPGVGTGRRAIVAQAGGQLFVGPDNGVFGPALRLLGTDEPPRYWDVSDSPLAPSTRSSTFHGRDLFAPIAAHLALGVPPEELGREITDPVGPRQAICQRTDTGLLGQVISVDHFGNLTTNVPAIALGTASHVEVTFPGRTAPPVSGLFRTYEEGPSGAPMALIGSSGHVEIAICRASAAERLHVLRGASVEIRLLD